MSTARHRGNTVAVSCMVFAIFLFLEVFFSAAYIKSLNQRIGCMPQAKASDETVSETGRVIRHTTNQDYLQQAGV